MVVDTSLYETALGWMTHQSAGAQATGIDPEPRGSGMRGIAPYQVYPCSDGYLMVAAANDRLFVRLAGALGHPQWPSDSRFESNRARISNLGDLNAALEPVFRRQHARSLAARVGRSRRADRAGAHHVRNDGGATNGCASASCARSVTTTEGDGAAAQLRRRATAHARARARARQHNELKDRR